MVTVTIDYKTAKGWLLDEERELLFKLAAELPPDATSTILNIGVEYGASVVCLRAGNSEATIYASDIDWSKYEAPDLGIIRANDSHELIKTWNNPLDLIFVDGDHSYDGVLLDARFADWLTPGHYILFQDCYDHVDLGKVHALVPGVNQAVTEWYARSDIREQFIELPYVGSTRVFKRVKNAPNSSSIDSNLQPQSGAKPGRRTAKRKS